MSMPGFHADLSLGPATGTYRGKVQGRSLSLTGNVAPQIRISSDPDLGAYWRCRLNGGSDLICRFFGGLPPFTIGGVLIGR